MNLVVPIFFRLHGFEYRICCFCPSVMCTGMERTPSNFSKNSFPLTPLTARPKTNIDVNFYSGSVLGICSHLLVFISARLGQVCSTPTSCVGGPEFRC